MPTTQGSYITPDGFVNLKARVKAEMNRRNGYGSLTNYAAASYDYTVVPASGGYILEEHFDKIRDVMANINPAGVSLPAKAVTDIVVAMDVLEANMTTFEAKSRGATSGSDCASYCSGMCVSQCTTGCYSCGGCDGGCYTGCYTGCYSCGGCDGGCYTGCSGSCSGSCNNTCTAACWEGNSACSSCTGTCQTGCNNTCYLDCFDSSY